MERSRGSVGAGENGRKVTGRLGGGGDSKTLLCAVAGVLDKLYSWLTTLSGVAVQARQSTWAGTVSIPCSMAGRYGYSAELA